MCSHACHGDTEPSAYPQRVLAPVGRRIDSLYKKRLDNFLTPGQWEKVNLLAALNYAVVSGAPHVELTVWSAPGTTRPTFAEATCSTNTYRPAVVGDQFGPSWTTHWFRVQLTVPADLLGCGEGDGAQPAVELHWDCSNEATVWTADGVPLQGLTGRGERVEWILPASFRDGRPHVLYVEMACNGMFGNGPGRPIFKNNAGGDSIQPPDQHKFFTLAQAALVAPNHTARMLYWDFQAIHDAAKDLPEGAWEAQEALSVASRMMDAFDAADARSLARCRAIAATYLGPDVDSADVYARGGGGGGAVGVGVGVDSDDDGRPTVFAVGHCHIDTCWLWPWAETKRKVVRSWSNQCDLMDRYPELTFACSQAQQFQWLRAGYPAAWERVRAKVASGQFQPIGGCWVEHDTNLPGGESLVRQFLYGQRFFEAAFGARSTTCWLPDTFGFTAQLPQLCRLAGMHRFLTQKPCFNSVNEFPHTTFNWVALDGSQVVCHMPPAKTYCAEGNLADIRRSISNHKSLDKDNSALLAFGKGDGGGGPTWQHCERLRRIRGMSNTMGTVPRVHCGASVDDFFARVEHKARAGQLATWHGELYFELHRGVYTTQATTKRNNRQAEFLLHDLELLATIASIEDPAFAYPKKELDEMWQGVLLCQFHDCLPGSAIKMCYDDSDAVFATVFRTGRALLSRVFQSLGLDEPPRVADSPGSVVAALNTLPWPRDEFVALPDSRMGIARGTGALLSVQPWTVSPAAEPAVTVKEVSPGVFQLANKHLSVAVQNGRITSLYDRRAKRQVLSGPANQFALFDDKPLYWQAWDVEVYHLETRKPLGAQATTAILEDAPHRVSVVTTVAVSPVSSIRSVVALSAVLRDDQPALVECAATIDWHESMKLLKVEFPVRVRSDEAAYETQYGVVRRPTHYNTSWNMAKFEVCGHKFADLSEHTYGVSILNDCKYGFSTAGQVMSLSLLRAPKAPDDSADMGRHHIRWAILPHRGRLSAETVRAASVFNNPLRLVHRTQQASSAPAPSWTSAVGGPVRVAGDDNLVLDMVKRAEDDEDVSTDTLPTRSGRSIIVRVYDALGGWGRGTVQSAWPVKAVFRTNLLEDDEEEMEVHDGAFDIELSPFQVCTYRIVVA